MCGDEEKENLLEKEAIKLWLTFYNIISKIQSKTDHLSRMILLPACPPGWNKVEWILNISLLEGESLQVENSSLSRAVLVYILIASVHYCNNPIGMDNTGGKSRAVAV